MFSESSLDILWAHFCMGNYVKPATETVSINISNLCEKRVFHTMWNLKTSKGYKLQTEHDS